MPRQGQRGVNPFGKFGWRACALYPSLSLPRHLPLKGGDYWGLCGDVPDKRRIIKRVQIRDLPNDLTR